MFKLLVLCFFCLAATVAAANENFDMRSCQTSINDKEISLEYDTESHEDGPNPWLDERLTRREKVFVWWSKKINRGLNCPSAIVIAEMAPDQGSSERAALCLYWDKTRKTYTGLDEGRRNRYGVCKDEKPATVAIKNIAMLNCQTSIDGEVISLKYDVNSHKNGPNPWLAERFTDEEKTDLFSKRRNRWNDSISTCPSPIVMAQIALDVPPDDHENFCLQWDEMQQTYISDLVVGRKNVYGVCTGGKTVCQRVNSVKDSAVEFYDSAEETLFRLTLSRVPDFILSAVAKIKRKLSLVPHSSGVSTLTSTTFRYITRSLSTALFRGSSSVVTAPITLIIVGVTAAGAGGAVYLCWNN